MQSVIGRAAVVVFGLGSVTHLLMAEAGDLTDDVAAFARLTSLEGEWQGRIADEGSGERITIRYDVVSSGKAVIEHMFPDTPHDMVTVYYLASGRLQATHYCSIGNQPAYALSPKSTADELVFDFAGGSGFDPAKDQHAHDTWIRIVDENRIVTHTNFFGEGTQNAEVTAYLTRR